MKLFSVLVSALCVFSGVSAFAQCQGSDASAKEVAACVATNKFRAEQGLPAVKLRTDLNRVARAHAKDMATRGYFEHDTPEGVTPSDRLNRAGIANSINAENIAAGQETGADVVESWKGSPGHRENLMNNQVTYLGMGEYQGQWVQVFIAP